MRDAAFRSQFGLLDWEETLLTRTRATHSQSDVASRLLLRAGFRGAGAHGVQRRDTGGRGVQRRAERALSRIPAMRAFSRTTRFAVAGAHGVIGALLDACREFSGAARRPRIAILDWDDVPTRTEFELYRQAICRVRHSLRHRRSARVRVPRRETLVAGRAGRSDLQARA